MATRIAVMRTTGARPIAVRDSLRFEPISPASVGAGLAPPGAGDPRVAPTGQFVEVGSAEEILQRPKNPYTRELLAAVPGLPRA